MATAVTRVAVSTHLLRYLFVYDGAAPPETVTRTNAQLLADMQPGPLRALFNVAGLSAVEARNRCLFSPNMRVTEGGVITGTADIATIDINVDGSGRPQFQITFMLFASTNLVTFEFRHSEVR